MLVGFLSEGWFVLGVNLPSRGWTAQGGRAGTDLGVLVLPTVTAAVNKELLLPVSEPAACPQGASVPLLDPYLLQLIIYDDK